MRKAKGAAKITGKLRISFTHADFSFLFILRMNRIEFSGSPESQPDLGDGPPGRRGEAAPGFHVPGAGGGGSPSSPSSPARPPVAPTALLGSLPDALHGPWRSPAGLRHLFAYAHRDHLRLSRAGHPSSNERDQSPPSYRKPPGFGDPRSHDSHGKTRTFVWPLSLWGEECL